jgi:hypothetical protein
MRAASRSRRWKLLACAIAGVVLAACSGGSSPSGTPRPITPRPEPTPTPEPSPWSSGWPEGGLDQNWEVLRDLQGELFSACYDGTPVPGAAPYGGKVHPLVVVDMNNGWLAYDVEVNEGFRVGGWPWPTPIQLVVCARHDEKVVGSCGLFKTEDGEVGEVVRSQDKVTFRVVVAETGKTLQTKVLSSPAPKCPGTKFWTTGNWGWTLTNPVSVEQIDKYAMAVSKQKVE